MRDDPHAASRCAVPLAQGRLVLPEPQAPVVRLALPPRAQERVRE